MPKYKDLLEPKTGGIDGAIVKVKEKFLALWTRLGLKIGNNQLAQAVLHVVKSGANIGGSLITGTIAIFQNNGSITDSAYITVVGGGDTLTKSGITFGDSEVPDEAIIRLDLGTAEIESIISGATLMILGPTGDLEIAGGLITQQTLGALNLKGGAAGLFPTPSDFFAGKNDMIWQNPDNSQLNVTRRVYGYMYVQDGNTTQTVIIATGVDERVEVFDLVGMSHIALPDLADQAILLNVNGDYDITAVVTLASVGGSGSDVRVTICKISGAGVVTGIRSKSSTPAGPPGSFREITVMVGAPLLSTDKIGLCVADLGSPPSNILVDGCTLSVKLLSNTTT
jgi:hypothetical protein